MDFILQASNGRWLLPTPRCRGSPENVRRAVRYWQLLSDPARVRPCRDGREPTRHGLEGADMLGFRTFAVQELRRQVRPSPPPYDAESFFENLENIGEESGWH